MASLYPAVCSRPPWAPGWCLHCGAPGWKAPQHLPPLCECVQERTQLTLRSGRESEITKRKRVMICTINCKKTPQHITPSRTDSGFCVGCPLVSHSWHFFFIQGYWSGGPAVCLFIFKNNSLHSFYFDASRGGLQRPHSTSFPSYLVCRWRQHGRALITTSESSVISHIHG